MIFHWFLLVFWRASPSKMLVLPMVFDREVVVFSLVFVGFSEGHKVGSRYRPQVSDDEVGGRGRTLVRRRKVALAAGICWRCQWVLIWHRACFIRFGLTRWAGGESPSTKHCVPTRGTRAMGMYMFLPNRRNCYAVSPGRMHPPPTNLWGESGWLL